MDILIREDSEFNGLGGRHIPQILISLANGLIYANGFIRVPLFFLRIPKNSKSKIVCPPRRRVQNFSPPPS